MDSSVWTGITDKPLDITSLHNWAKSEFAGAVVTFSGITRNNFDGKKVTSLTYDCYKPLAEKSLAKIAESALALFSDTKKVALFHRIGEVPLSEESVIIVVSAAHRGEAWKAGEWILEEVKATVEIWKREIFTDGSSNWVESCQTHREVHLTPPETVS